MNDTTKALEGAGHEFARDARTVLINRLGENASRALAGEFSNDDAVDALVSDLVILRVLRRAARGHSLSATELQICQASGHDPAKFEANRDKAAERDGLPKPVEEFPFAGHFRKKADDEAKAKRDKILEDVARFVADAMAPADGDPPSKSRIPMTHDDGVIRAMRSAGVANLDDLYALIGYIEEVIRFARKDTAEAIRAELEAKALEAARKKRKAARRRAMKPAKSKAKR